MMVLGILPKVSHNACSKTKLEVVAASAIRYCLSKRWKKFLFLFNKEAGKATAKHLILEEFLLQKETIREVSLKYRLGFS